MSESVVSIGPELFAFFRDLKRNNNREWFAQNRVRYEEHVKLPLLEFIRIFEGPLHGISPHYTAIPKVGGSLFRIYRDIRFSKDKRPYKTAAGVHFRHEAGKSAHAPGFYLHLEPSQVFAAVGIWGPDTGTLRLIRQAIVDDADAWRSIIEAREFSDCYDRSLHSESLKRAPQGFDPNHEYIDDLKRKHFVASVQLTEKQVSEPGFIAHLATTYQHGAGFMAYLTRALGLPW